MAMSPSTVEHPPRALGLMHHPEQVTAALHPLRRRILTHLRDPASATAVAEELGLPRQKVNYHVRALEKEGLVEQVAERRKGNCVERLMRATATNYLISPAILGELGATPGEIRDRFSGAYLVATAARTMEEVVALRAAADEAGKKLPTLTLRTKVRFATADDQHAFARELSEEIARLVDEYHDASRPEGRDFRLVLAMHPAAPPELLDDEPHSPHEQPAGSPEDDTEAERETRD